jgi:hypothetical protein
VLERVIDHLRANVVAYLALFAALGAGGGYAYAATGASSPATITVCASTRTGALFLHQNRRPCKRGFHRVTWPGGHSDLVAGGNVAPDGRTEPGENLIVKTVATGVYQLSFAHGGCGPGLIPDPVATINGPPPATAGVGANAFPVALVEESGVNNFEVVTGTLTGGVFSASNESFDVEVGCG